MTSDRHDRDAAGYKSRQLREQNTAIRQRARELRNEAAAAIARAKAIMRWAAQYFKPGKAHPPRLPKIIRDLKL
jgi:hypothetical protein